jgi:hypothetical protein
VSQPSKGVPPYRIVYSQLCRDTTKELLTRAVAQGQFAEVAQAVRDVNSRLEWIPLDFGEPLRDLLHLGIQVFIGSVPPLVVEYGIDEARRIVYVSNPFKLLPNSGL